MFEMGFNKGADAIKVYVDELKNEIARLKKLLNDTRGK